MSKKQKPYHHNNLKEALIIRGIQLIHEEGAHNFSLRKLAREVGVSATACYNHFENADDLFTAMRNFIADKFEKVLSDAIEENPCNSVTVSMGCAYVKFFASNPHYFTFLFDNQDLGIQISETDILCDGSFSPFAVFQKGAKMEMANFNIDESQLRNDMLIMWASVHGLAAMANVKGFHYDGDWTALTEKLLFEKVKL
ncbi:MAG TPA: TetR/AcrR family transcriptional regulator [Lachnospiraceae bacterium]|nr:TetR/AcrR family transcriptional regulator [Lachnospiraceae bacterium]